MMRVIRWTMAFTLLMSMAAVVAQEADAPLAQDEPEPIAPDSVQQQAERGPPKPPRPALEQYMQPTPLGLRLTPRIARGLCQVYLRQGMAREIKLTDQQATTISEQMAQRLMRMAREKGQLAQELFETGFSAMMAGEGKLTGDAGRKVAEKLQPVLPLFREFERASVQDARPHLQPEQIQKLEENLRQDEEDLSKLEATCKRWCAGDIREGENLLVDVAEKPDQQNRTNRQRSAERMADMAVQQAGTETWKQFLENAQRFFHFDPKQIAAANTILERYVKYANDIMTDEWKNQLRQNRIRYNFRWEIGELSFEPWLFQLEQEYRRLVEPIRELEKLMEEDVVALATPEQRTAALSKLREMAAQHGMSEAELNAMVFPMIPSEVTTSAPATSE